MSTTSDFSRSSARKYELLRDDTVVIDGVTLYRIRAVRQLEWRPAGSLGGYIESEDNLSHEGRCWVDHNALVCGHARISGDAEVVLQARVCDHAEISGAAGVRVKARVTGHAKLFGNAYVTGD